MKNKWKCTVRSKGSGLKMGNFVVLFSSAFVAPSAQAWEGSRRVLCPEPTVHQVEIEPVLRAGLDYACVFSLPILTGETRIFGGVTSHEGEIPFSYQIVDSREQCPATANVWVTYDYEIEMHTADGHVIFSCSPNWRRLDGSEF